MDKLKVVTLFSGYDSQCLSLDRIHENYPQFDYELIAWSEIDNYAIQAHNAIYPQYADINLGDVCKIDWSKVEDFDLLTYSSPCQDFSSAGLQKGGIKGSGTRSSLLWECERAIESKRPKYLLMENVAALVSSKFIKLFNKWQLTLERYGYTNYAQVLNAKEYGVPQNRERIFMVSVRDDLNQKFYFPQPFKLEKRLKDILEDKVDEKYYLSEKYVKGFEEHNKNHIAKGTGFLFTPKTGNDIGCCVRSNSALTSVQKDNLLVEPKVEQIGNIVDDTNIGFKNPQRGRIYGIYGISPALNCCGGGMLEPKILEFKDKVLHIKQPTRKGNYKIRKLTPKECFRLMDVCESNIDKLLNSGISNSQLYKLAGNSIVVSCLYHIFTKLFLETENDSKQLELF